MSQTAYTRQQLEALIRRIEHRIQNQLPRKIAVKAKNHFTNNFRVSGFVDGGVNPWQPALRERGRGTDARYKTLTSRRNHLSRSIQAVAGAGQVEVSNPVPYAQIHNEGGTIRTHPRVTRQMKKMAWAKFFSLTPKGKNKGGTTPEKRQEAEKWKGLALTKKSTLNIRANIPKRTFIGESKELREIIENEITNTIEETTSLSR